VKQCPYRVANLLLRIAVTAVCMLYLVSLWASCACWLLCVRAPCFVEGVIRALPLSLVVAVLLCVLMFSCDVRRASCGAGVLT